MPARTQQGLAAGQADIPGRLGIRFGVGRRREQPTNEPDWAADLNVRDDDATGEAFAAGGIDQSDAECRGERKPTPAAEVGEQRVAGGEAEPLLRDH